MTSADRLAERARQEADNYIKRYWGSMALENINFDVSLYDHWLAYHDAYIDTNTKIEESEL